MLVKILSRHSPSYKSLFTYILNEEKVGQIFTKNLRSDNIEGWEKEYIENEALRNCPRKDNVYLYHEIVSVAPGDKNAVSEELLADIANEYMKLRGNNGMYIGAVHRSSENIHIHFAVSGLEYRNGKAFRLSKDNLHDLKTKFQEFHRAKYPELEQSFCEHGKRKEYVTDRAWQARNREERDRLKAEIETKVHTIYDEAKSEKDFLEKLRSEGLPHYERGSKATGIEYEDMKFRFSRLDIDMEKLNERAVEVEMEKSDEQKALDEIQSIRDAKEDKDRDDLDRDDDKDDTDDRDMDDDDDFDR